MVGVGQDVERGTGGGESGGQGAGPVQGGGGAGLDRPEIDRAAVPDDGFAVRLVGERRFARFQLPPGFFTSQRAVQERTPPRDAYTQPTPRACAPRRCQ
ncbi:hypothetical protein [Streptomyces rubiginosohelvolus]|uniref:hypothetical protein n=1 Tax=Streptomyces rubiginosohelvolus TaxID=67362 RepID=UPI0035DFD930